MKLLIAVGFNIVLWELVLRIFISSPCTQLTDGELGYVNVPLAKFVYSQEGYSRNQFNSIGFNDDEPIEEINVKHIFFVGDSYTESFQVARRKSYVQLLEIGLNQEDKVQFIDVIKLARDGFNPAYYPLVIDRFVNRFSPDFIVLQFWAYSGGDLYLSNISCQYSEAGQVVDIQVHSQTGDRGKDALRSLINNSALLYHALRRVKPFILEIVNWFPWESSELNNSDLENSLQSIEDMTKRLSFIINEISRHNSKLIVLYIPKPGVFFREDVETGSDTLQALKTITAISGIPLINLTDRFEQEATSKSQMLNGFANTLPGTGHLNRFGHMLVASDLLKYFSSSGL